MISKYMRGRLGNQMFQYAMIRKIQEENNNKDNIYLNFSKYVYSKGFDNELKYFNVRKFYETENIKMTLKQKFIIIYFKLVKRFIRFVDPKNYYIKRHELENKKKKYLMRNGLYWMEDGYLKIAKSNARNKLVIGHFESSKNFDSIRPLLLKEFEPLKKPLLKNKDFYKKIKDTNSICVTIRRGDYVTNKEFAKKFNVCDVDYFNRAIEIMNKKVENPVYFIFSDDIDWCRANIKIDGRVYYEDGTDPVWEKLRLMYSCKHFIISNSTFSFWAQYLSRNSKKIVIAPSIWAKTGYTKDIYEKNWITL